MRKAPRFILLYKGKLEYKAVRMSTTITPGNRVHMGIGEFVKPEHWDKKAGRVDDKFVDLFPDYGLVNERLEDLEYFVVKLITEYRRKRELYKLTPARFRSLVKTFLDTGSAPAAGSQNVLEYYEAYVLRRQKAPRLKDGTKVHEMSSFRTFARFVKSLGYAPEFDDAKLSLFEAYRDFITNGPKPPLDVTVSRHIKRLKEAMGKAYAEGLMPNFDPNSIKLGAHLGLTRKARETVALTAKQLKTLQGLDLSHRKGLERLRDLFVVNCYLGLRYNRWGEIHHRNVIERDGVKLLEVIIRKGQAKRIVIPIHPIADAIASRYGWDFGRLISNQKANKYLQEIAQLAGFNDVLKRVARRGQVDTVEAVRLYELIRTHTARRTFITIQSTNGLTTTDIQGLTGQSTKEMVEHYTKETPTDRAVRIAKRYYND